MNTGPPVILNNAFVLMFSCVCFVYICAVCLAVCVCVVFVVSLCRVACDLVFACFCLCSVYMDESRLLLVDIAGCLSTFAICFMFDCDMFDLAVFVCCDFLFFCF